MQLQQQTDDRQTDCSDNNSRTLRNVISSGGVL